MQNGVDTAYRPWIEYQHIWRTEASFMNFIRGGIRRGLWEKNPIKLEFLKERTVKIKNTNPRSMKRFPTVNAGCCDMCGVTFKMTEMQVDHKLGGHSLKTFEDISSFIHGIVFVKKEDLQLLCKGCHDIKTYAERQGISLEEAAQLKEAIAVMNLPAKEQKAWLIARNITPLSTADLRREQVIKKIKEG